MVRGGKGKGPGAWQSSAAYQVALDKIVATRNAVGMTQKDLADALGKPPSWVGKVEIKERRLDLIEFIAVARALGIKEVELLKAIVAELPKRLEI
jgi:transcriptional regulator with XRE-family HTH domain